MHERGFVAGVLAALAACYDPAIETGAPCPDGLCPEDQQCDPVDRVCKPPTAVLALRDDTAADFAATGADIADVTVEAQGFVGPPAFFTGGVRVTGIAGHRIPSLTTTFAEVIAEAPGRTAIVRGFTIDYGADSPLGLDIDADDVTVVVEAEIELDVAGNWGFELTANDIGFLEIAPPGSADFVRLVADDNAKTTAVFQAPAPGWYRVRGAFADAAQLMRYELKFDPPNVGGNFRDIPADRIRARVGDVGGLLVDGFENTFLVGHRGSVVTTDSLERATFRSDPFGIGAGVTSFSLRWTGQFLIDVEGEYAFRIESFEGHRVWIDGTMVADEFVTVGNELTVTSPINLVPGWHDVVIDLQKSSDEDGELAVTVASGPAFVDESFPADHVRPVAGRVGRWAGDESLATLAIPDVGAATQTISLDLPRALTATRVDATIEVTHPVLPSLQIVVNPPAGADVTVAAFGSIMGTGTAGRHRELASTTAGTTWDFVVSDNTADLMTGSITYAGVTIVYDGGVAPFPTSYRYTSRVHELGEVSALGPMTWGVRQGAVTAAVVELRTCDTADACATEPFTPVTHGAVPAVAARRFAQYAVQLSTNGDVPTALDFVDLPYSALAP